MNTFKRVKEIVVDKLQVAPDEVIPEASFVDDLGADSLDLVELIMEVEEKFDTDINDEDAEKLITVGDAVQFLSKSVCYRCKKETEQEEKSVTAKDVVDFTDTDICHMCGRNMS